jgi:palmitoyltransferase
MEDALEAPTRTGFTRPFVQEQVGSWIVYSLEAVLYFTMIYPTLTTGERIGVTIPWVILFTTFNVLFVIAELDSHISAYVAPSTPGSYHCDACHKWVSAGSKHCGSCDLCRPGFDHHCFFLNNCVTNSNYRYFLFGVFSRTAFSFFTVFLSIWTVMATVYYDGATLERASQFYHRKVAPGVIYGGSAVILLIQVGVLVFMGYLLALHWALNIRQITTYQLIVYQRQAKLEADARSFSKEMPDTN